MGLAWGSKEPLNQSCIFVNVICKSSVNAINLFKTKNNGAALTQQRCSIDLAVLRQRRDILCMQHYGISLDSDWAISF
jgi:hypothetical protein